jgi:hypothetical protein
MALAAAGCGTRVTVPGAVPATSTTVPSAALSATFTTTVTTAPTGTDVPVGDIDATLAGLDDALAGLDQLLNQAAASLAAEEGEIIP